jgi:spore maturation protein CgeB|tara:strand:- start:1298 stop:2317 length:1020 start_codon:yes stop_codon:yes gene_type:complete
MRVLYIGTIKTNSKFEYLALKNFCKSIDVIDCNPLFLFPAITRRIFHHISPKIFEPFLNNFILSKVNKKYDLIYVNSASAAYIGQKLILNLKEKTKKIVVSIIDNPFVKRDKNRWKLYLDAALYYDLTATYIKSRLTMGKKYGIKNILLSYPPYQKDIHCKKKISIIEKKKLSSEIVMIGTWFPERGIFFKKLMDLGLDFKIYGTRWEKDPNYHMMKSKIKLGHIYHPMYSKLIQCSKISICLPSSENVDGLTRRSIEIPAIGTLLCAKRTIDHKNLFKENKEAIFFNNANECYKKCINYLKNEKKRKQIAYNGHIKVTKILKCDYSSAIKTIIKKIDI